MPIAGGHGTGPDAFASMGMDSGRQVAGLDWRRDGRRELVNDVTAEFSAQAQSASETLYLRRQASRQLRQEQ